MVYFLVEWEEKSKPNGAPRAKEIKKFYNPIDMFKHILKYGLYNYAIFTAEVAIEVQDGEFIE